MRKYLIIISGDIGKHFLKRILLTNTTDDKFSIVYYNTNIDFKEYNDKFIFHSFDSTSYSKLQPLLKEDFAQIFMLIDDKNDTLTTIKNIRDINKRVRIILIDSWSLDIDDLNIILVNSQEILTNRLINYLPDIPVVAENIGLGSGEIMEILVPFGSSYVYRHIKTIRQKNWKITAIYRNNSMILASSNNMIQPNDRLLIVGQASVLKSVFNAIKQQLGQFPAPYGKNLYLFIDMADKTAIELKKLVQKSLYLHRKFSHVIYIRIINPNDISILNEIKQYNCDEINVVVNFKKDNIAIILEDIELFRVGLIIIDNKIFAKKSYRKIFFEAQIPVLKITNKSLRNLNEAIVPISDNLTINSSLEKLSTAVFDISSQLDLKLTLFNFSSDEEDQKPYIIEQYDNLSDIFSKKFHILHSKLNPIRALKKHDNFLQCIPFTKDILPKRWHALFSTDLQKLFFKLDEYHQIFIPTKE